MARGTMIDFYAQTKEDTKRMQRGCTDDVGIPGLCRINADWWEDGGRTVSPAVAACVLTRR